MDHLFLHIFNIQIERLDYYLPSGSGSQVFYTNATERLRITSTGIVQIATDAVDSRCISSDHWLY